MLLARISEPLFVCVECIFFLPELRRSYLRKAKIVLLDGVFLYFARGMSVILNKRVASPGAQRINFRVF